MMTSGALNITAVLLSLSLHIDYRENHRSQKSLKQEVFKTSEEDRNNQIMSKKSTLQIVLKVLMILLSAGWISLWLLKPTELWTKSWHKAEDGARETVLGYYGLNFIVYSLPVIAVAVIGYIYLHLTAKEPRSRQMRMPVTSLSNPIIIHSYLGIISGTELLAASLFISFLAWTIYAHISKDFRKITPVKSLKLNIWQFKFMKIGTRLGLLAEACLALLLLPVLRGMSIFRLIGIQFEASVRYHVCLGTAMLFFSTLHGLSTLFIWGVKHRLGDEVWLWQKTGRVYLAGELALVTGLVIWITSLPQIRRRWFELFYYTHHLYAVFLVLFLFHAGDRHFYMVFSGILLFGLDKLLRLIQSRPATSLVSARILPCKAIELNLSKHPGLKYTPTSTIFIKVPSISKLQWHPFSITSSSSVDDERISVIVKVEGWWTNSLYNKILTALDSNAYQVKCLPVHVEGPYGPASTEFLRYDSLLLVAGGIGITPFLSVLQEIVSTRNSRNTNFPAKIQLIYTVKKSQDISLLNPISPLLLSQSGNQPNLVVKIFVTQEEKSTTTVTELLTDQLLHVQTVNFNSKCLNDTTTGPESLPWLAGIAGLSSIIFLIALSCLNHIFLPYENKASEKKNPSWVIDVLLICSFVVATTCGILVIVIMKLKKTKNNIPPIPVIQNKGTELSFSEAKGGSTIGEHEIHYGGRPNFEDIISQFPIEAGTTNIGVLVCGPESMKESVALLCRQHSQGLTMGGSKGKKPHFSFHSLNFAF